MVVQIIVGKYIDLNDWAEGWRSLALGSFFGSFGTSRRLLFPRWVLQVLEQAPYSVCCFAHRCNLCSGVHRVLVHPQRSNKSSKDDGKLRATSPESSSSTSSNKSHRAQQYKPYGSYCYFKKMLWLSFYSGAARAASRTRVGGAP